MPQYPIPSKTNGLLLTLRPKSTSSLLVIGSNRLASSRVFAALEAGYTVYVAHGTSVSKVDDELEYRIRGGEVRHIELDESRLLDAISEVPDLEVVCVTDSLLTSQNAAARRSEESCALIAHFCRSRRIHINIVDRTAYNDVSFPATHRWRNEDGQTGHSLQIAVNTFGKGCRLATRIRREIVASLPAEIGKAVDNVAMIRASIIESSSPDQVVQQDATSVMHKASLEEEDDQIVSEPINTPVLQYGSPRSNTNQFPFTQMATAVEIESAHDMRARRMKWVAQISEYWPIRTLGRLQQTDIERLLTDYDGSSTPRIPTVASTPSVSRSTSTTNLPGLSTTQSRHDSIPIQHPDAMSIAGSPLRSVVNNVTLHGNRDDPTTLHSLSMSPPKETTASSSASRVLLLGSGPGHPALLTIAAYNALRTADLVLADKLVPAPILALLTVEPTIAKKFPGNAESAQNDLQQQALDFILQRRAEGRGATVVRLKQGDPFIYGRGGEELLFFRSHGIETLIVPGISSALAAPLLCNIPVTQRGVADSLILCTGVGRAGKTSIMPGYKRSRTLIVLMGVARIGELITALTSNTAVVVGTRREADVYPEHLPIALIERGSCRDQRMVLSTLSRIEGAIERVGDQRPPGMLVIGWSCLALEGATGNVTVTEPAGMQAGEQGDLERVNAVLGEQGYLVREGIGSAWMDFLDEMATMPSHKTM